MKSYALCGWHVASEIALPELAMWRDGDRPVDVVIRLAKLAGQSSPIRPGVQRVCIPDVATYEISDGREIVIDTEFAPDAPEVRLCLLGRVFGILCHQRGILPLHGVAVAIDAAAVVIAGPSGAGKSTLGAAFLRRGFKVLADDVVPIEPEGAAGPRVLPGVSCIRLWRDSLAAAGWSDSSVERCRAGYDKFARVFPSEATSEPLPPAALLHIGSDDSAVIGFEPLRGANALNETKRNSYRPGGLVATVGAREASRRVVLAAAAFPRHLMLRRPRRLDALDQTVDAIVDAVRAPAIG